MKMILQFLKLNGDRKTNIPFKGMCEFQVTEARQAHPSQNYKFLFTEWYIYTKNYIYAEALGV